MNTEPIMSTCPKCGGIIPGDAPQGLCPHCVLSKAATRTDVGLKPGERIEAPSLEVVVAAFPQLEILELVGVGGMGVVYKARQANLDRLVALKLLPLSLGSDPAFTERFHREARFLARLNHPNIVSVFDFGQSGGFCYLLLEFVDGVNLRQAMQAGRFSPAEALTIVPDICRALQYAHEQGVLHRDIKPENILLDARGRVKLADFGIAKLVREPGDRRSDVTLTQSGARLGTPHYMAPEQIETPSKVDHRADIYSLGVVFYELLTGELPIGRFAPPSEKADLDARVDAIVFRALAKERELRQQSVGELKTQVEGLGTKAETQPSLAALARHSDCLPNPWPHRLYWLVIALVLLPAAAVVAAVLAPMFFARGFGTSGGLLAALVPVITGAVLWVGFVRTRPALAEAKPRSTWSPWPRRLFWALSILVVMPGLLLAIGLVVPTLMTPTRSPSPTPRSVIPAPAASKPNGEVGGLPEILPTGTPTPAAMKWHFAWEQLQENRRKAGVGLVAPHGPEVLAAERDVAVAEAEFRGNASAAASANLDYAKAMVEIMRSKAGLGLVAPRGPEVLAAERDVAVAEAEFRGNASAAASANLDYARAMVEITHRKFEAGRATQEEFYQARQAWAEAEKARQKLGSPQETNGSSLP